MNEQSTRSAGAAGWDDIRIAFAVARHGTVSAAASALGMHHATVIRHIDALEARLGVRLFQRHARGYTPTEAGNDLLQVAAVTDDQFTRLERRIRGQKSVMRGELIVSAVPGGTLAVAPVVAAFARANPEVTVRLLSEEKVARLEYGEAHVAIRGGAPTEPDNVGRLLARFSFSLCAAPAYIAANGLPEGEDDLAGHRFAGFDRRGGGGPFLRWLSERVPADRISFRSNDFIAIEMAVIAGAAIGFVSSRTLQTNPDLVEVLPTRPEWDVELWVVTHVDMHRTAKVQAFLNMLKEAQPTWPI